jgi:hypothetical protein
MHPAIVDLSLLAATGAYARWLAEHKVAEPDFVWAEVVIGTALCLGAAGARSRLMGGDWRVHEANVWRAFIIGGVPIIAGELLQWQRRQAERRRLAARWMS